MNISLSAYYYRLLHPRKANTYSDDTKQVVAVFKKHFGNFGRRTIYHELQKAGIHISQYRIAKILKEQGLYSKYGRKRGTNVHTSAKVSEKYIKENLFKQLSKEDKAKNILSMDFTEQKVNGKKVYTCGAININSKVLEGELCDCQNNSEAACKVVEMAIKEYGVPYMITTDRGSPFVSKEFQNLLESYGIIHSMSRAHTPVDNCYIETFWKTMKTEIGNVTGLTKEEYKLVMEYYRYYYNNERPHSTLGYCPPITHTK